MTSQTPNALPNDFAGSDTGPTVDGWVLRALLGVACVAVLVLTLVGAQVSGSLISFSGVVLLLLVAATLISPGSIAPLLLLLGAVIGQLMISTGELNGRLAGLVAAIPLAHQLAGICAVIPPASKVDLTALRPAALRYVIAVGVVEVGIVVASVAG